MIDFEKIRSSFPILDVKVNDNKLVYFDNAATTQTPTQVTNSIRDYFNKQNSNIHRGVHHLSNISTEDFEQSRKKVKEFIGAEKEEEIVFTRGTTDSINLVATSYQKFLKNGDEILISEMEHHSNIVPWQLCAEKTGAKLKVVSVTKEGEIDMDHLEKLLNEKTKILSITHISNTLGTINPISEITKLARKFDTKVFIDGAQAIAHQKVNVTELDVDFYCFSAHKLYGPKGIGLLYISQKDPKVTLEMQMDGGGHEKGYRSGTLPVPLIVGFAKAMEICENRRKLEYHKLGKLRNFLFKGIQIEHPDVILNGSFDSRLSHNLNLCFPIIPLRYMPFIGSYMSLIPSKALSIPNCLSS